MSKQKLKIGLLINNYSVPLWAYTMIEEICKSNHLEIVLVVTKETSKPKIKYGSLKNIWRKRNTILFRLYSKFENKLFNKSLDVFQIKNLKTIIDCEEVIVTTHKQPLSYLLADEQIHQIKSKQIDVIISTGFKELESTLLNFTKNGIWYYHHGNYNIENNKLSGVWEILKKTADTRVSLNVLRKETTNELIIYKTAFNTDHLYIWRNRSVIFWKSKSILRRKLNELYELGDELFFQKAILSQTKKIKTSTKLYKNPNNFETLKYVIRLYAIALIKVIKRQFYFEQWILLFNLEKNQKVEKSFKNYSRLLPPKDRFWADPFIIKKNNKNYIFFEELLYNENRGKISVIEMDNYGNYTEPEVVLEKDYHLSYPFLIEDNGELYMIPETEENRTIELYKCIKFPDKWELVKVLFNDLKAVDSTIIKHDDKFWLFTNICEYKGEDVINELFLFYSDSLISDSWTSHPENPITTDHTYSRPAGKIYVHENRLFRPAQNCSKHYGYGIQIQEIIKMNVNEYEEINTDSIYPNWDNDLLSTHTINASGNLTFIDAKISRKK